MYSSPFIGIICKENVPLPVNFKYSSSSSDNSVSENHKYSLFQENCDVQKKEEEPEHEIEIKKCPRCGNDPCICDENTINVFS